MPSPLKKQKLRLNRRLFGAPARSGYRKPGSMNKRKSMSVKDYSGRNVS